MANPCFFTGLFQILIGLHFRQHVWHRRHTRLVPDAHGFDLVIHLGAQIGFREPDIGAQFLGQALCFFIKHQEDKFGFAATTFDKIDDLFVLQQIVVDVLDGLEFGVRLLGRAKHVRVLAAITIDIADIFEILDPFIKAQQVKVGRRNEIDRVLVAVKEPADFRDILKHSR